MESACHRQRAAGTRKLKAMRQERRGRLTPTRRGAGDHRDSAGARLLRQKMSAAERLVDVIRSVMLGQYVVAGFILDEDASAMVAG